MKTYWDYSEQERANLTEDEVKTILDIELMTNGVKKPVAPKLEEIPKSPLGAKEKFYAILGKNKYGSDSRCGVVFHSVQAAEEFIALSPLTSDYDYEVGSEHAYAEPLLEVKIEVVEFFTKEQVNQFRSELKSRKAKQEANTILQAAFDADCKKSEQITEKVWKDWHNQQQTKTEMQSIVSTFKDYVRLSSGDEPTALKFLERTYVASDIKQAREWFPGSIHELPTVEAA